MHAEAVEIDRGPAQAGARVWVLTDDRPGHTTQVVGLADAIGLPYEVKHLRFNLLNRISNGLLGSSLISLDKASAATLGPPWPDLVIAMGRRTAPIVRWIGAQAGGRTRLVQLGRKGADVADAFDLSITCTHFRLPQHPRRLEIAVPITKVTPEGLVAQAEAWRHLLGARPGPHMVLLVGGTTAQHRLNVRTARRLIADVQAFSNAVGGSLYVVTSRRTSQRATQALRDGLGDNAVLYAWSANDKENPYLGYLALADILVVTGESESMLAEAAVAGKTLFVYPLPERKKKLKQRVGNRFYQLAGGEGPLAFACRWVLDRCWIHAPRELADMHKALYSTGAANPFGVPLEDAASAGLHDSETIVSRVQQVLEADTAPRLQPPQAPSVLARLGWVSHDGTRTFWVQGEGVDDFLAARPLLVRLRARYPRVKLVLVSENAITRDSLGREFPDAIVVAPPAAFWSSALRMVKRLNPRLVILLGAHPPVRPAVLPAAAVRQVPVVVVGAEHEFREPLDRIERVFAGHEDPDEILAELVPMLARDLKLLRSQSGNGLFDPYRWGLAFLHSGAGRRLVRGRFKRLGDLEELRHAIGAPDTILCLGNGPSSEDPSLRDLPYDSLFRVNDRWLNRGQLDRPDMVFTGDQSVVGRISDVVFGFQDRAAEERIKLQRWLGLAGRPVRFTTVADLPTFLDDMELPNIPTNGSTMLATAVALQPKRLIIAGIDLFQHPDGSYPGDPQTPNAYTPRHSRDVEIAIAARALELYQGEVTIVGDALRRAIDARPDTDGPARHKTGEEEPPG